MRLTNLARLAPVIAIVLTAILVSGCAPCIKYSYDAGTPSTELKTYQWTPSTSTGPYHADPLLDSNVQFIADKELASKGFTRKADGAELLIWMGARSDYQKGFQVRTLTLNIARADNRKMIWQGVADGTIKTDAGSNQLDGVVRRILSSFPPK